jgi:hypothetical protein
LLYVYGNRYRFMKLSLEMVSHNQQNYYMPLPDQPMGWWSSVGYD